MSITELQGQLNSLPETANTIADFVNARGATLEERLKDVPLRVRELVLHAISHGATFALAGAELSGADVRG